MGMFAHMRWLLNASLVASIWVAGGAVVQAQTELQRGVLQLIQVEGMAERLSTVSQGVLADLQLDPNFGGDFQMIFNEAAGILDGYTVVRRGGYFPENAGIPREQQLTVDQAVYRIYKLENGNELMLYRTPTENTSRYFIRQAG